MANFKGLLHKNLIKAGKSRLFSLISRFLGNISAAERILQEGFYGNSQKNDKEKHWQFVKTVTDFVREAKLIGEMQRKSDPPLKEISVKSSEEDEENYVSVFLSPQVFYCITLVI